MIDSANANPLSNLDEVRNAADPAAKFQQLLALCVELGASDLHLVSDLPPHARVEGPLRPVGEILSATELNAMVEHLLTGRDRTPLERTGSIDGAITSADGTRFRFNVFRRQGTLALALRRLEDRFRTLKELGLPDSLYELSSLPDGLVVIAGPTGSGKSTTLATLLDRINKTRHCHLITIEDPIEYVHRTDKALVNQRQIGTDASTFNDALVASLRQDPDVILVGEIRDLETIRTAITAAETGHLVFTTVHAGDCVGAIERLVSVFPADEQPGIRRQLALVVRAIVAQHLLVADGNRAGVDFGTDAGTNSGTDSTPPAADAPRRRVLASEVLIMTPAVANMVALGKPTQIYSAMESGTSFGMRTLEQCLADLAVRGTISEQTALTLSRNGDVLKERIAHTRFNSPRGRTMGGMR